MAEPSSASAPAPRGRQEQGNMSFMSRSQNIVTDLTILLVISEVGTIPVSL